MKIFDIRLLLKWFIQTETTKFDYNVGMIYTYDYTGETASKINGTSEEESRLHMSATAEFEVVSKCELILRVWPDHTLASYSNDNDLLWIN